MTRVRPHFLEGGLDKGAMARKQQTDAEAPNKAKPQSIQDMIDGFLSVLSFMTRLPVPGSRHTAPGAAVWAFPIAGLIVGAIGGAVFWIAAVLGLGGWPAAFLALATTALATGALHEDGLADSFDGLWGGHDPENRIAIMRDSRIGGFGALALILATGLKASLLAAFADPTDAALTLVATHGLSRVAPALLIFCLDPASKTGLAGQAGRPGSLSAALSLVIGGGAAVLLTGAAGAAMLAGTLIITLGAFALLKAKLGGHNGDTLGGTEQTAEIVCLIAAAIVVGTPTI